MKSEHNPNAGGCDHCDERELRLGVEDFSALELERATIQDAIDKLSRLATLSLADTYITEDMGVQYSPDAERGRLNQSLGEVILHWNALNTSVSEARRCIGLLQYMIDPENN